ncbi:MAG TPA: hypothetical protein VF006_23840 [Longimicrobium sp.]
MRVVNNSGQTLYVRITASGRYHEVPAGSEKDFEVDKLADSIGIGNSPSGAWVYFEPITDHSTFEVKLTSS